MIDIGSLKEGDEMPSVREVAIYFKINPNTVQRAFLELRGKQGSWKLCVQRPWGNIAYLRVQGNTLSSVLNIQNRDACKIRKQLTSSLDHDPIA